MQRTFGATQVVTIGADTVKTVLAIIIVVVAVVKAGSVLAFFLTLRWPSYIWSSYSVFAVPVRHTYT